MNAVTLVDALDESEYGGKAVSLGRALRSGLNVPPGLALDVATVDAIACGGDPATIVDAVRAAFGDARLAVRSSAVGEDSDNASFAGQHVTRLGVRTASLVQAILDVHASGRTDSALGYRRKLGLDGTPLVAVVIQKMIDADRAGVMFTVDPVTGADVRVVEASWGLGEAVVSGLVTPDRWTVRRGGDILEEILGEKDIEIVATSTPALDGEEHGGVIEREIVGTRAEIACLSPTELHALDELASLCETHYDGASDIEFCFEGPTLYLLQRRAVTR